MGKKAKEEEEKMELSAGMPSEADVEFAATTSLHGIQHLVQRTLIYKITWGIFIIAAICICMWQIIDRVTEYFQYPTAKEYDEMRKENMAFPTVTICSAYRYRDDLIKEHDAIALNYNKPHFQILQKFEVLTPEEINHLFTFWKQYGKDRNSTYPKGFNFTDIILRASFKLDNQSLIVCQFNGFHCHVKDFTFLLSIWGELCWSFNSHLTVDTSYRQMSAGPGNGLIVIIDFQRDKHSSPYQSKLSKFNMYLSPFGELGLGFNQEIPVGPGEITHAKVQYSRNKYLPSPYGNCLPNEMKPPYGKNTLPNCLADCAIKYFEKYCGCLPYIFPGFYNHDVNYCDFKDVFLCKRSRTFWDNGIYGNLKKLPPNNCSHCITSCTEEVYDTSLYYTYILDSENLKYLMQTRNLTADYLKKNYLILDIYYENFHFWTSEQKALMTVSSLMSDIGGAFGLFMGMSILTILEILDYIVRRCRLTIKAKRNKLGTN